MIQILILATLLQDPPIEDRIDAYLKGDVTARAELVKLGIYAIRPLQRARDRASEKIDALVFELKKAASIPGCEGVKGQLGSVRTCLMDAEAPLDATAIKLIESFAGRVFFDFDLLDSKPLKSGTFKLRHEGALDWVILDDLCRQTGLDYGLFHNHVVLSHPERLWPAGPVPPARLLTDEVKVQVRKLIEKLNDESIEIREAASRDLYSVGRGVIPLLEEGTRRPESEVAGRCKALIHRLTEVPRLVFGSSAALSQTGTEKNLKKLRGSSMSMSVRNVDLMAFLPNMTKSMDLELQYRAATPPGAISLQVHNGRVFDLLSLITQSRGLDFVLVGDALVVDTRDAIDKLLQEK